MQIGFCEQCDCFAECAAAGRCIIFEPEPLLDPPAPHPDEEGRRAELCGRIV